MKRMTVFLAVLITISAFAEEAKPLKQMNLSELSQAKGIPVERVRSLIVPGIGVQQRGLPLEEVDPYITDEFIQEALDNYLQMRTLLDLVEDTQYPIKKLKSELGLDVDRSAYERPLRDFGISAQRIEGALNAYEVEETRFLWSIVATGMIIVFIALAVTGLAVGLLEYLHRLRGKRLRRKTAALSEAAADTAVESQAQISQRMKRRLAATSRRNTSGDVLDAYTVVAIAAAIRLHEAALEEENRILATWTKAPTSVWKANRVMPNRRYFEHRGGK